MTTKQMIRSPKLFNTENICLNSSQMEESGNEIIRPIVIMKPGVFNSFLKIPRELDKSAKWWNVPIVIKSENDLHGHPEEKIVTNNTIRVGQIKNAKWDVVNEKLIGDAYIYKDLCPSWLLNDIENNKIKGVSGTYFADLLPEDGEVGGKKYTHIEHNYVPNNVTIVDNPVCTPSDGCGINVTKQEENNTKGDNMTDAITNEDVKMNYEKTIEELSQKIVSTEAIINSLKEELKMKDTRLKEIEMEKRKNDFLSQFPIENREAAANELLPIFMEDPSKLVLTNSKRLRELLISQIVPEQSKGSEHVNLEMNSVIENEDKEIESIIPDIEKIKKMIRGKA